MLKAIRESPAGCGESWQRTRQRLYRRRCCPLVPLLPCNPAVVLTTAPTARQVRHVLWREIRRLHGNSAELLGGRMFSTRFEVAHDRFALGLSTDEADQFQGFHSPNMLVVVDEAEGVAEPIYDAIEAVMTTSNCKLMLIGNPTSDSGTFRRAFHEDRRMFHNITISALESPNVEQQEVVIPGLTTGEWVAERRTMWGEGSPMYQARVLGQFCDHPQESLIPLSKIEQAISLHAKGRSESRHGDPLTEEEKGARRADCAGGRRSALRPGPERAVASQLQQGLGHSRLTKGWTRWN